VQRSASLHAELDSLLGPALLDGAAPAPAAASVA
jgi:hypothetical protein